MGAQRVRGLCEMTESLQEERDLLTRHLSELQDKSKAVHDRMEIATQRRDKQQKKEQSLSDNLEALRTEQRATEERIQKVELAKQEYKEELGECDQKMQSKARSSRRGTEGRSPRRTRT